MKGGVTSQGFLFLDRPRRGKPSLEGQACPFTTIGGAEVAMCGDWCPHFGEPEKLEAGGVSLEISCGDGRRILFDEFDDKRLDVPKVVPT